MFIEDNRYSYKASSTFFDYEFESVGGKGVIKKVARFSEIGTNVYNFGFGDLNEKTGEITDVVVSNNGDDQMILLTVAHIIYLFTSVYPNAVVVIQGTTLSRTRRYQMGINKYWEQINPIFEVYGLLEQEWESFRMGTNYSALLGCRKAPIF